MPKRKSKALSFGDIIHKMLEKVDAGKLPWKVLRNWKKDYQKGMMREEPDYDLPDTAKDIVHQYMDYYENDPLNVISAEENIKIPIGEEMTFQLYYDGLSQDRKKKYWLMERKTGKTINHDEVQFYDLQTALYIPAIERVKKIKITGIIRDYIRSKPPVVPELLKSGELSKAKNQDTTWSVYKDAVKDNGLDLKNYKEMKEVLQGREENFFKRMYIPINENIVKNLTKDFVIDATELKIADRMGFHPTKNIDDRFCCFCDFNKLCFAELKGLDTKPILMQYYTKRTFDRKESDAKKSKPKGKKS